MAQIPSSGFVVELFRGGGGSLLSLGFTGGAVLFLLATCWVQAQNAPASNSTQKNTATTSTVSPVTAQEGPPPTVIPAPSVEQKPPQPPAVAWDGKQLTIDADNSTLADILVAVRKRTGASVEIPGAASGERVFVHLGPGPVRDIISSLLYGTTFDYIIETSEDDPDTLRSVVLTARGQSDSSGDVVVAGATNTGEGSSDSTPAVNVQLGGPTGGRVRTEGMRMMPGWAGPGKPAFQADAEAALAAKQAAAQDSEAAGDDATGPGQGSPATAQGSVAAAPDSAAAAQSAATTAQDAAAAADAAESTRASNSPSQSDSTSNSDDPSGVGQAIHNMTRMFEQRRQIQTQQNQPPPPPPN